MPQSAASNQSLLYVLKLQGLNETVLSYIQTINTPLLSMLCVCVGGGGEGVVGWRSHPVSYITGASNWYWRWARPAILVAGKGRGECFLSSVSSLSFLFLFLPVPSLSSTLLSLLSLFSLSLEDDIKWPTRVGMSLNPNTINLSFFFFFFLFFLFCFFLTYCSRGTVEISCQLVHFASGQVINFSYLSWDK